MLMKIQAGLLHLDAHPVQDEQRHRLLDYLHAFEADITGEVNQGSLLMSYHGDRITEEEDCETQPYRSAPHILTFDGRLDNRDELFARIGAHQSKSVSDPELVLAGVNQFGDAFFRHLVGEFALVLWCSLTKRLRFVRSACGARSLYYTVRANRLFWASDFRVLVEISSADLRVNDNYAIQYLLSQPSPSESPIENIHPAPANRILTFQNGRLESSIELWDPTRISPILYKIDADYEAGLRVVVKEAVSSRMRSKGTVFAELSGGLDSSTVTLMGDAILRERGRDPRELQTVSCVYDQSTTCDERRFIALVEERRGVATHPIKEEDQRFSTGLEESPEFTGVPNPLHCLPGRYAAVANVMRQNGARVLLTGMGGDHLFWSDPDASGIIADEIFRGHFLNAHRECKRWSRRANTPYYELLFGRALPQVMDSGFGRASNFLCPQLPVWLHRSRRPECVPPPSSFELSERWRTLPSKRAQAFVLEHFFRTTGAGLFNEYSDCYVSHPYSYRPLVEFCLGTPLRQFLRDGETRSLMRRAFRDLLPPRIAARVSKGLVDESFVRILGNLSAGERADVSRWEACQREYADADELGKSLNQARLGMLDQVGSLFKLFSLERWLRSLCNIRRNRRSNFSLVFAGSLP